MRMPLFDVNISSSKLPGHQFASLEGNAYVNSPN